MLSSVAHQAPSASHQATTAFHDIDLRIRALTTILSILDPQAGSPTKGPSSIEFKVAMHIATLLTRGADERRGKMGPNIRPIAVATRTTVDSVNILATIDRDDNEYSYTPESGLSNHFVVTQNPTPDDRVAFGVTVTEIESKDLNDVQRDELLNSDRPPEDITLGQHAADVMSLFNNIRTVRLGGSEQALAVRRITEFIVRRCAPIISHRLRSDKFIFQDTTLDKILQGWRPSDGDHFVKTECEIPERLVRPFQTVGIQCRRSNGKYFASWTKDIAPAWMEAFLSCLSMCKDCFELEGKKVAGDTAVGATALKVLQTLVESEGFKYLLGLGSVNAILLSNRRRARSNTENTEDPSAPSDAENTEDPAPSDTGSTNSARSNTENPEDSDDDNSELTAETEEDPVALTMRYLGNAVAWITATDFLFSSSRIRRTPRLRLHLAITAPPVDPKAMEDAVPIFTNIFSKTLKDWEDQSRGGNSRVRTWYWQSVGKLRKCKEFHGTVHCEASLMGAIVQYNGQANNTQNTQLPEIFHSTSNKPRTMRVAKKCCWCCTMLATLLNSTDIQFSLPGSHGRIFPWALPSMGISYEVACSLEDKLQKQLSLAIWKMLDELKHISESQTSSPVSDGSSSKLELEGDYWDEAMDKYEHKLHSRKLRSR